MSSFLLISSLFPFFLYHESIKKKQKKLEVQHNSSTVSTFTVGYLSTFCLKYQFIFTKTKPGTQFFKLWYSNFKQLQILKYYFRFIQYACLRKKFRKCGLLVQEAVKFTGNAFLNQRLLQARRGWVC